MKAIATVLAAAAAALLLALPAVAATRPHDAFNDYSGHQPGASVGWTSIHPGSLRPSDRKFTVRLSDRKFASAGWT
jgi:hypothetical protein